MTGVPLYLLKNWFFYTNGNHNIMINKLDFIQSQIKID